MIPLQFLNSGEAGRIVAISGDPPLVTRLNEMGLREGVEVHMVHAGVPCIVAVENHRLTFRGGEMADILVEPVTAVAPAAIGIRPQEG